MGVLTHLDQFKKSSALQKVKKSLKHRFWSEIYQGEPIGGSHIAVLTFVCRFNQVPNSSIFRVCRAGTTPNQRS